MSSKPQLPGAMRRLVFLVLALGVGITHAFAQSTDLKQVAPLKAAPTKATPGLLEEPRDIVDSIYKIAAEDSRRAKPISPFLNPVIREKYFSKGFDVAVTAAETRAAHDGKSALDFDPISASPDAELKKVTLKTDLLELSHAVVSASFMNHGQPTVVSFDFVKDGGAWKIDDIKGTTEKEAWSVRKILAHSAREPKALPGMRDAVEPPDASLKVQPPQRPSEKALQAR